MTFIPLGRTLPPTEKLFHSDPYLRYHEAKVLFVRGCHVVTDSTIFYAESGGQASDRGTINGIGVIEVSKQSGDRLTVKRPDVDVPTVTVNTVFIHTLSEEAPFKEGDTVKMEIDWQRRYTLMRHHSASHFLFYAAHQIYDQPDDVLYTKGCSIGLEGARFDFGGSLSGERIKEVEEIANGFLNRGGEIIMEPEPLTAEIYYWKFENIIIPCGGTHVKHTSELAPMTVRRSKQGATTTRISLKFGA